MHFTQDTTIVTMTSLQKSRWRAKGSMYTLTTRPSRGRLIVCSRSCIASHAGSTKDRDLHATDLEIEKNLRDTRTSKVRDNISLFIVFDHKISQTRSAKICSPTLIFSTTLTVKELALLGVSASEVAIFKLIIPYKSSASVPQ
jgi:hypothetical protein